MTWAWPNRGWLAGMRTSWSTIRRSLVAMCSDIRATESSYCWGWASITRRRPAIRSNSATFAISSSE